MQEQFAQRIDEVQYRVMRETIGAACHHISHPMTAATAELDLMLSNPDLTREEILENLKDLHEWIAHILRLQGTREYKTTPYCG